MDPKADPKFQKWLSSVSPNIVTTGIITTSIDWATVLQILWDIFQVLLGLGCFAAAKVSSSVKIALKTPSPGLAATQLAAILSNAKAMKARKNNWFAVFLAFILVPAFSYAVHRKELHEHTGHQGHREVKVHEKQKQGPRRLKDVHGIVRALGLVRNPETFKLFKHAHHLKNAPAMIAVPALWDLTPKVSPPLDQGQCGDCWNFSIFKAFWSENLLNGLTSMPQPAANFLLNNCSRVSAASEYGCNGGDFPAGLGMLPPSKGPWAESNDPYTAKDGSCKSGLASLGVGLTWVAVGDGVNPPTFQQLALANYNNGKGHMLSVDVDASDGGWMSYSGGIYSTDAGSNIDHMINLVGYNCETSLDANGNCTFNAQGQPTNGDGYLIVENNWNTTWGENGYMRTRWGMNAIAQTAFYFTVVAPPVPVPTPTPVPVPTPPAPPTPTPQPVPVSHHSTLFYIVAGVLVTISIGIVAVLVERV